MNDELKREPYGSSLIIHHSSFVNAWNRSASPLPRPARPHAGPDAGSGGDDRHHSRRLRTVRIRPAQHSGDRVSRRSLRKRGTGDAAIDLPRHESGEW